MASLVLAGDTSGSITVSAPTVAGSTTQTLVNVTGTLAPVVSGTAVTASSTSVDFTSIPSWVKRITVMFNGVSTSGTSNPILQIGTSSGIQNTGYSGTCTVLGGSIVNATNSTSFAISNSVNWAASNLASGQITLSLLDNSSGTWSCLGAVGAAGATFMTNGSKTLSGTLDRVRITTVNGTDTFDAGTINILYE